MGPLRLLRARTILGPGAGRDGPGHSGQCRDRSSRIMNPEVLPGPFYTGPVRSPRVGPKYRTGPSDRGPGRGPKTLRGNGDNIYPPSLHPGYPDGGLHHPSGSCQVASTISARARRLAGRRWLGQATQPGPFDVSWGRLPLACFKNSGTCHHVVVARASKSRLGLLKSARPGLGCQRTSRGVPSARGGASLMSLERGGP